MSIRVHKLAKELGLSSKELVEKLHALKIDAKGHMSNLDDKAAEIVREKLKAKAKVKPALKEKKVKERPKKKPEKAHKEKAVERVKKEKVEEKPKEEKKLLKPLEVKIPLTVKELSVRLSIKPSELIKKLMAKKIFANINKSLTEEIVKDIAADYGYEIKKPPTIEEELLKDLEDTRKIGGEAIRPPVVTLMGHVDHGKTSLLDYIRKTNVAGKEKGGITQHIGAYEVMLEKGAVTFLDTPGHEAFTAMRARGANATDIVVLVVAADDGIMPQTKEAISHAKAANVPIVVAINKCDLAGANIDKVKRQLAEQALHPEDWGGSTITMPVSAKTGEGVKELLEMLLLEAEMLELKANPNLHARGVVIEGKLSPGRGVVTTLLVKNGTLRVGDVILSGLYYGKVKAMINDKGAHVKEAPPSMPVELLGLSGVPQAGDEFFAVRDEKKAKTLSLLKQTHEKERVQASSERITLEQLYDRIKKGDIKDFKIIIKADVVGSLEALKKSLEELSTKEITLSVIHGGVGNVNESDVVLAMASGAIVIGFHVKVEEKAKATSEKEKIDIRLYNIIYEVTEDIKAAMEGQLEPATKEVFQGKAEVRQVFKVTKVGTVAGCLVTKGKIARSAIVKLFRGKNAIYEGKISNLKRFKDDAREVAENFECGIALQGHNDIKPGDVIAAYTIEKIARRLK